MRLASDDLAEWPHLIADDGQSPGEGGGAFEGCLGEIDDPAAWPLLGVVRYVSGREVWPHNRPIVDLAVSQQLVCGARVENEPSADGDRALEAVSAVGREADGSDRSRVGGVEGRVDGGHLPSVEHDGAGRVGQDPVDKTDMDLRVAGPLLRGDRVGDRPAVPGDVGQGHRAGPVLRDRVGTDQACSLAGLQVIVGQAEPADAVILDTNTERPGEPVHVVAPEPGADVLRAEERRVSDDRVGGRPDGAQRIGDPDPREVNQGQRIFRLAVELDHLPVAHPQRHPGDEHRRPLDLQPSHVRQRDERPWPRRDRKAAVGRQGPDPRLQLRLERPQLPVRDVQEVAAPARGVEHGERAQLVQQLPCLSGRNAPVDPRLPG